ncbi:MAG: hypothetical protein WDN04_14525 [Rhodospirillales bacterium]
MPGAAQMCSWWGGAVTDGVRQVDLARTGARAQRRQRRGVRFEPHHGRPAGAQHGGVGRRAVDRIGTDIDDTNVGRKAGEGGKIRVHGRRPAAWPAVSRAPG